METENNCVTVLYSPTLDNLVSLLLKVINYRSTYLDFLNIVKTKRFLEQKSIVSGSRKQECDVLEKENGRKIGNANELTTQNKIIKISTFDMFI